MNEAELVQALAELGEEISKVGGAVRLIHNRNAHDLELLSRSLVRSTQTLDSIVNVLIDQQL